MNTDQLPEVLPAPGPAAPQLQPYEKLRLHIDEFCINQSALARKVGKSKAWMCEVLKGVNPLLPHMQQKIEQALNIKL